MTRRRAWGVVGAWMVVLVVGLLASGSLFTNLGSGGTPQGEASRTQALLNAAMPTGDRIIAVVEGPTLEVAQPTLAKVKTDLAPDASVATVTLPIDLPQQLVDSTRTRQLVVVDLVKTPSGASDKAAVNRVVARLDQLKHDPGLDGATVLVGGGVVTRQQANALARQDLTNAEIVTLPIALLILVLLFGGVAVALVPVATALTSVSGALLLLTALGHVVELSTYTVNVVTMFGLGLSVDYGLLTVSRFREERATGADVTESVRRLRTTSGRTVLFSALMVLAALLGLLVFTDPVLRSLSYGGAAVIAVALTAARTLVPALLILIGNRVSVPAETPKGAGFANLARWVTRRPWPVLVAVIAVLAFLSVPDGHLRQTTADVSSIPVGAESRVATEAVRTSFPLIAPATLTVVVDAGQPVEAVSALLKTQYDTVAVTQLPGPGGTTVFETRLDVDSQSPVAERLVAQVRGMRAVPGGPQLEVTGDAAALADRLQALQDRLPLAILLVLFTTTVLLFWMTGSLVVPLKVVVVAALSLSASLGTLVWAFQDANLAGLLKPASTGSVDSTVPVLVFVFAFGLSVDYEVFLLSRVQEAWRAGAGGAESVAIGLQRTGRVITGAAMLVVVVFAGFAAGRVLPVQQTGFGLAVAVVLDATVVRCLLVPATMVLLGRWNWWAPGPLRRLHQRLPLQHG